MVTRQPIGNHRGALSNGNIADGTRLPFTNNMFAAMLGKLFTPIVPLPPSSIIWYLVWAFMLRASYVAAMHGSNEQGEYCRAVLQRS